MQMKKKDPSIWLYWGGSKSLARLEEELRKEKANNKYFAFITKPFFEQSPKKLFLNFFFIIWSIFFYCEAKFAPGGLWT